MVLLRHFLRSPGSTDHLRRWLVLGVVLVNLGVLGLESLSLWRSHHEYEERAEKTTQNLVFGIERALSNNIAKIDLTLLSVADELERQLAVGGLREEAMNGFLERHRQRVPELDAIRVADAAGRVILGRGVSREAPASWADREYFQRHREHHDSGLLVTKPQLGRVSGKWQIGFSRRFNHPDGSFAGVIASPLTIDHFSALLATLEVGRHGAVILRDSDLALVTRHPAIAAQPAGTVGNSDVSRELRGAIASGAAQGTFHAQVTADGVERIFSFRRLSVAPFIAIVGLATEDYLAAWWEEVRKAMLVQLGFLLITVIAASRWWRLVTALKANQALYGEVLAGAHNAIIASDPAGRVVLFNRGAEELLGYRAEEVVGRATLLGFHDPAEVAAHNRELSQELGREATADDSLIGRVRDGLLAADEGEWTYLRKDGRPVPVWLSVTVLHGADEAATGYLVVASDITRRKAAELALVHAKEAAEAASQAKSRFLATISHEIRTPMNGMLGMAQLLLLPGLSEEERREYARTILNSGNVLLALLNDILDLSRAEAGKFALREGAFEPARMLAEIGHLFTEPAASKGLHLSAAWEGEAGACYRGDPLRLRQMLSNLVSNAVKFTASGEIRIVAQEIAGAGGDGADGAAIRLVEFSVSDSGPGIAPEQQGQLFRPFSQLDDSSTRQHGGSGLGLSIVRSLAELMGGRVGVDSAAGAGARFWFRLPLARVAAADVAEAMADSAEAVAPLPVVVPGGRGHILVAEDNATNREVLRVLLTRQGFQVSTVATGEAALGLLTEEMPGEPPDLVLMDCHMPVLDGWAATRRLRQWEAVTGQPRRPVIALTAAVYAEDEARCREAGMDDFLAKPVDGRALLTLLDKWLPGAAAEGAAPAPASHPLAEPTPAAEGAALVFDADNLLVRYGRDEGLARFALTAYLADSPGDLAALQHALAGDDVGAIARQAHTLAGSAGTVSGLALVALAQRIEDAALAGDLAAAAGHLTELNEAARRLNDVLADFLAQSPSP